MGLSYNSPQSYDSTRGYNDAPRDPLRVRVDLRIDGSWVDVSADTLARDAVTINRGRPDEASAVDTSTCALTLGNNSGRYSPRNPSSPYFTKIGRNTPIRVGTGIPPAGAGTAGQTGTSIVAPSLSAETAGTHFAVWAAAPAGDLTVPAGYAADTERDGTLSTWQTARKSVAAGSTGTATATHSVSATAAAALSVVVPGTLIVAATSGVAVSGADLDLTSELLSTGDYVLAVHGWSADPQGHMSGAPSDAGTGRSGWLLVADTGASTGPRIKAWIRRSRATGADTIRFAGRADAKTDTYAAIFRLSGVSDYRARFTGEVSAWPQRADGSGRDVVVPVAAAGILRRLGQGDSPLHSVLRRYLGGRPHLVGYWPLEDEAGAEAFASAIGGLPMTYLGAPALAADSGAAVSQPLPTFTAAGATARIAMYPEVGAGGWVVGAYLAFPATGMVNGSRLLSIVTSGSGILRWEVDYTSATRLSVTAHFDDPLYDTTTDVDVSSMPGTRAFFFLSAAQNGANIARDIFLIRIPTERGARPTTDGLAGAFTNGQTVGRVAKVSIGRKRDLAGDPTIGHVVVSADPAALYNYLTPTTTLWDALVGWDGEAAAERIRRLCREQGVPVHVQSPPAGALMGPQPTAAFLDLIAECETADGGVLYEPKGFLGLAYRTRAARYNQSAELALSYAANQLSEPFEPVEDDQRIVNDVTVNRPGGSSARATLDTGPLSTAPPPAGIGRYDTAVTANVYRDADLPDEAAWRLHLGTWDELRYPAVSLDLLRDPSLAAAVGDLDVGDRVTITGLPAWLPPGDADLHAEGFSESLAAGHPDAWTVTVNTSPAAPYRAATLDSASLGRLDGTDSTLATGLTTTQTSVSVATAAGSPPWITTASHPADFPFDAAVGGEVVTVTAIVNAASPQTWTVTRSVNGVVKTHATGTQIRLARPSYIPV